MSTTEQSRTSALTWLMLFWIIALLSAAAHIDLPSKWNGFLGDSATYYAMARSLVCDHDLQYTRDDLIRITQSWINGPQGILLVADDTRPDIIHYAKPILYPLIASIAVYFRDTNGLLIVNVLCFAVLLWSGFWAFPGQKGSKTDVLLWSFIFWGLSAVPAYIFTLTPDLFNSAILMLGLMAWLRWENDPSTSYRSLFISAFILGVATAARPPNALFLIAPLSSLLWRGSQPNQFLVPGSDRRSAAAAWRCLIPAIELIVAFIIGTAIVFLITQLLIGQTISHGGDRKRIVGHFPFESPEYTFDNTGNEISTRSTKFIFHWDTLGHNLRYFFIGRFSGLIPYYLPAAMSMILALPFLRKSDSDRKWTHARRSMWIVCTGLIVFHLVYIPSNYHGGSCAVGNRYLISFLPAFFLLLRQVPQRRTILAIALITGIFTGPIALNPIDSMAHYRDVSKRTCFNPFPPEITLLNSWPLDDPRHMRVPFDDFHVYFADDNQWGQELGGFWVKGDAQASLVLRCWKPVHQFSVRIRNGGSRNTISGTFGSASFSRRVDPGTLFEIEQAPGKPVIFYNLNGDPSYCYSVTIRSSDGFIPRFTEEGSTDGRYLGCFVEIRIQS